jgi:hypothetical protein
VGLTVDPLVGTISAVNPFVNYNSTTTINWNVTEAGSLSCGVDANGSRVWTGLSGSQATAQLTSTTTYNLICGSAPGTLLGSAVVGVLITPELTAPKKMVNVGTFVDLTHRTYGLTCDLKAGGNVLASNVADGMSTSVQVNALTTYTLDCVGGGTDSVTIEIPFSVRET